MFDAMLITQAESFVGLTTDQFPAFVARVKRLQDTKIQQTRRFNKAFNELRQLVNTPGPGKPDDMDPKAKDAAIEAKLKELDTIDAEGDAARAKALEAVNQLLTPVQRAKYRLLEDNLEKRKMDFLIKVRQPGKGGQ
jgi:Spy/CpxP family protein refolding chaperone